MAPTPCNNIAYTAAINPPSATPVLTISQIWAGLEKKIRAGQDFVGSALVSTDVLSTSTDKHGRAVTEREVVFREGNRRVHETCVAYEPMKVEFLQPDGSKVQNIISQGADGELYMTYTFEWLHPDADAKTLAELREKELKMAKVAVERTIATMKEMVTDGRIQ